MLAVDDAAQQVAQYLSRPRLGKLRHDIGGLQRRDRAQFGAHGGDDEAHQRIGIGGTGARDDEGDGDHPLDRIVGADDRAFGDAVLLRDDLFHLTCR